MSLKGKVALITGASSGIGYTTALLFASHGCSISVTGRNEANLARLRDECLSSHPETRLLLLVGDVTVEADVERIVASTLDYFSRLDILVNNAGILESDSIMDCSLAQFDRVMTTNVRSVFHLTKLCAPRLQETRGCVVNVSSVTGQRAFPGVAAYCTSKSAVDQLTRCAALDLAPDVRVNAVNPGLISTELHRRGGMSEQQYAEFVEKGKTAHVLGRIGATGEVAEAILFLADGQKSGFMTGNTLPVDGGKHVMCPR